LKRGPQAQRRWARHWWPAALLATCFATFKRAISEGTLTLMEWNRSTAIALASMKCAHCQGLGMFKTQPCDCVTRAIFKACFSHFTFCAKKDRGARIVNLNCVGVQGSRSRMFGWRDVDYMVDFNLICKRTLTEAEWEMFRFHYLLGADAALCARRLNMDTDAFQRACNRIESKLGRAFRETEPFGLYPLDEYMSPTAPGSTVTAFPGTKPTRYQPLRPPMAA